MAVIDPVTSAPASSDVVGRNATSRARLAENFDTFLTLLTTQLKNQDPLSPMDSTQFTQQMVQMTGVEQQLLTNDLLTKLVSNTSGGVATAVSLIGKEVRAATDIAALSGGQAKWSYKLDRAAEDVKLEIIDEKGRIVKALTGDKTAGEHTLTWNGKDLADVQLPNGGSYRLMVRAKDSAGADVGVSTSIRGLVTGVEQANGETLITLNGGRVNWERVTSIALPPQAPQPTTTPPPASSTSS
jgi:flagellar basal-body rod modification protein FlgD